LLKKRETALLVPPQKEREGRASCCGDHTQNAEFTHPSEADEGRHPACGREGDDLLFDRIERLNGWDVCALHGIKYIIISGPTISGSRTPLPR